MLKNGLENDPQIFCQSQTDNPRGISGIEKIPNKIIIKVNDNGILRAEQHQKLLIFCVLELQ